MPLRIDRSLRDHASWVAKAHGEDFKRVARELLIAVADETLPTDRQLNQGQRDHVRAIAGNLQGRRGWMVDDPQYPAYWLTNLHAPDAAVEQWLATVTDNHVSIIKHETACQAWLKELMIANRPPEKPRAAYKAEAQQRFKISARGFLRAWAEAIKVTGNTAWQRPGRKSKH